MSVTLDPAALQTIAAIRRKASTLACAKNLSDREIQSIEARLQAQASEAQFLAERGEHASREEELARCRADVVYWLQNWGWTFDPRLISKPGGAYVRFLPWPKQAELLRWLEDRFAAHEPGLIEKSRDQGVTYLVMAFYLHKWLFFEGFKASCTSRSEDAVDKLNDPDSMFEKLRVMLRRLPSWMVPAGFSWHHHDLAMRLINPANGSIITGEAGDEAGRSGRSAMYAVDEAAFLANASSVEAALSGNTDCVIWMSTVNPKGGMGNFFAIKRHSDSFRPDQIFRMHWRDDIRKDDAWASAKRASLSDPTTWEAEFEINYQAAVEGICIPPAWVVAAQRVANLEPLLHKLNARQRRVAGVDVGAGKAKSVYVDRAGPMVGMPQSRGDANTTGTAHWALDLAKTRGTSVLNYDANGPGIGVTSTFATVDREGLTIVPVSTGNPPTEREWPDERTSAEMFLNLRSELWWLARGRFERTYEHVLWIEKKEGGVQHPVDELICLPPNRGEGATLAAQLSLLKWMKNDRGKIQIESKDALRKRNIPSPDHADAFIMTLLEPDDDEALGIFKRPWFRMWPAFKDEKRLEPRVLPEFQFVLVSLRTAFDDERTLGAGRGIEPTACGVYGVFNVQQQFDEKQRKAYGLMIPTDGPKTPRYAALLCDFWYERLSFQDVADRVRESYRQKWGPKGSGKRPDVVIVEETTTDRSMRQTLTEFGVPAWPLARDQSRTMRAHQSAGFVQQGAVFVPESRRAERTGYICDWAEPMVKQACSFSGRGSIEATAGLDQLTSAILYLAMKDTIKAVPTRRAMPDADEEEERLQREAMRKRDREKRGQEPWYG